MSTKDGHPGYGLATASEALRSINETVTIRRNDRGGASVVLALEGRLTPPPCRLLLIEDDQKQAAAIEQACCPEPSQATIDVIANAADAEIAVEDGEYDLVICDLALPADERRFDPDTGQGVRLFKLIRERSQGTPVIILSGNADLQMMQEFFQASRAADLYGTRTEQPLVQFFQKERLLDFVAAVRTHIARTVQLDLLEVRHPSDVELSLSQQRAIRIYGRNCGAAVATLHPLDGGLSESRTFRASFADQSGGSAGSVVIKLGNLQSVLREAARYGDVAAKLPVGLGHTSSRSSTQGRARPARLSTSWRMNTTRACSPSCGIGIPWLRRQSSACVDDCMTGSRTNRW